MPTPVLVGRADYNLIASVTQVINSHTHTHTHTTFMYTTPVVAGHFSMLKPLASHMPWHEFQCAILPYCIIYSGTENQLRYHCTFRDKVTAELNK